MRRSLKSGQFSIEFLLVMGALLIVLASFTIPMYNRGRADAQRSADLAEAREAAAKLANALNVVYSSGVGSKQTIEYWLPKGVVAVYADVEVDNNRNGRIDVQIWFDWADENLLMLDTILPSKWDENGVERGEEWVLENCVHVEDENFVCDPAYRTLHRMTLTHYHDVGCETPRRIVILDQIIRRT